MFVWIRVASTPHHVPYCFFCAYGICHHAGTTPLLLTVSCVRRGGPELLVLLLRLGGGGEEEDDKESAATVRRPISLAARMMVNLLIAEVFQQVHGIARHRSDEMPIFLGLADHMPVLLKHLLRQEKQS